MSEGVGAYQLTDYNTDLLLPYMHSRESIFSHYPEYNPQFLRVSNCHGSSNSTTGFHCKIHYQSMKCLSRFCSL